MNIFNDLIDIEELPIIKINRKKYCKHGVRSHICKECPEGGRDICKHNQIKFRCKQCNGKSLCKHKLERYYCKDCGGRGICEHDRQRPSCRICQRLKYGEKIYKRALKRWLKN
jgi:hypothetical protein